MSTTQVKSTGIPELDKKIADWISWNKSNLYQDEVKNLLDRGDTNELSSVFLKRMEFGTAGLRGRMGPGFSQMNDLVIIQTGQGLLKYMLDSKMDIRSQGVVLGYDGRYNSERYAKLTASIFLRAGAKVYLFSKLCPTPFVAFAIRHFKCSGGVMVTASHNPKEDNGYKVYWNNGSQIISPHDKGIARCILESLIPGEESWDTSIVNKSDRLIDPLNDVMEHYLQTLRESLTFPRGNFQLPFQMTYSAMHGVGYEYIVEAFKATDLQKVIPVEEQILPDPEFPTVKFPNPEEGKSALDLSIKTADENGSQIILANDPDADRLAVAEKLGTGSWKIFTGNELGGLLGWWQIFSFKTNNPNKDYSHVYTLSSTVSSKILKSISLAEGVQFEETLTGFKWMGNRSCELMEDGKTVVFAFEEAIGFMCGSAVVDKDGVSAAVKITELAGYLHSIGHTLTSKLNDIYDKYGFHLSENSYFICHDQEKIKAIFNRLRTFKGDVNTYPDSLLNGKYPIIGIRDLTTGYDSTKPDKKATLPVSKSSQMITFTFENGFVATLRTSGTEPKLKYYTELCAKPQVKNIEHIKSTLIEMVNATIDEFLRPNQSGLIPRST